jgi:hypothetical protein
MIAKEAQDYFSFLAKQSGLTDDGLPDHINRCIALGLKDLWCAKDWRFKSDEYSLTIGEQTDEYELPSEFEGVVSVRETASISGKQLEYVTPEEFDLRFPKPSTFTSGNPQAYTVIYKATNRKYYIKIVRYPSDQTIHMTILTSVPKAITQLPEKASACLYAAVEKYLHKMGSRERILARAAFHDEVLKLEVIDSPFVGKIFKFLDSSDTEIRTKRSWEL